LERSPTLQIARILSRENGDTPGINPLLWAIANFEAVVAPWTLTIGAIANFGEMAIAILHLSMFAPTV